jgi:ABC-type antimicrobial peptide transport system permease subunit
MRLSRWDAFGEGLDSTSLMLHRLRSGLTSLGVIFGVAAVISMLAVGEGAGRDAQLRIEELGATNIILRSVKPSDEAQAASGRPAPLILRYGLKYADFERIVGTVPTIKRVLLVREIRKQIRCAERAFDGRVVGTTHDYAEFNHVKVARGRFLDRSDDTLYRNCAVLAHATAKVLTATYEPYHPEKDVQVTVPYELLEQARRSARQFSIILGTIASISLLVGGIGIMNIMLATVTDRTREIGIRRALGAKRRDIIRHFLIECMLLSGVGGLAGVFLGMWIPRVIVYFVPDQKTIITPQSVVLAFAISVGVGILFGIYPARRAALMDPIDALRAE